MLRNWTSSSGFNRYASFLSSLINTLVPQASAGSSTPTFTRATTAYVQDWEGLYKPVLSGEARFTGARRVYNRIGAGYDYTTWTNETMAVVGGVADPNGGTAAYTFTAQASPSRRYTTAAATVASDVEITSYWVRRRTGTGTVAILNPGSSNLDITASVDSTWRRFCTTPVSTGGAQHYVGIRLGTSGDAVDVAFVMPEVITGQSNQNPSEYVSVGVLSAPYHGANVDGVKYFTTLNGNTVASNVVTEATGAAITSATSGASSATTDTYGPFGYLAEGSRTNLCLQSQTFQTTWAPLTATVTADQLAAPDGTITADLLTAGAGTALHGIYQSAVLTSNTTTTVSLHAKAGTSSNIAITMLDAATVGGYVTQCFTLSGDGTVGQSFVGGTSGTLTAASITALPNGWYRLALTGKVTFATTNYIQITHCSASGNTVDVYGQINNAPAALTNYIWGAQVETASFASSYIPTTTVSVTRNADVLYYQSTDNIPLLYNKNFTIYAEVTAPPLPTSLYAVAEASATSGSRGVWLRTADKWDLAVGTQEAFSATAYTPNVANNIAGVHSETSDVMYKNGSPGTSQTPSGSGDINGNLYIGARPAGSSQMFGTIRNLRIYSQALNASQIAGIPTL